MKIYMANYATAADHACLRDDGGYDTTIEDMANNFPVLFSRNLTSEWIKEIQDFVVQQCADADPDVESEADAEAFAKKIIWTEVRPDVYHATHEDGDNEFPVYAVLIVQEAEIDE